MTISEVDHLREGLVLASTPRPRAKRGLAQATAHGIASAFAKAVRSLAKRSPSKEKASRAAMRRRGVGEPLFAAEHEEHPLRAPRGSSPF
jgi:hypothetical protein